MRCFFVLYLNHIDQSRIMAIIYNLIRLPLLRGQPYYCAIYASMTYTVRTMLFSTAKRRIFRMAYRMRPKAVLMLTLV